MTKTGNADRGMYTHACENDGTDRAPTHHQLPMLNLRNPPSQSSLLLLLVAATLSVQAQFSISSLGSFGSNGWLAPNGNNGSTYQYLTTGDTERGLAYGNGHVYLVSRNGGDFIRILDAQTGNDLGALNLGTGVVTGGTFDINMAAVAGDGAIYVANLAIGPAAFRVYRWANDQSGTTPTLVYSGVPLAGARLGDTLAVVGAGAATRLAAGFNGTPGVSGDNGYAVIDPTAGTAVAIGFGGTPPAAGDFRLGLSFTDSAHVIGTQGGSGSTLLYTSFSGTTGTVLATPVFASSDERPMSFAVVGGYPLLAALGTADSHVSIYDMTDPANPVLQGQANATTGAVPADGHNTGAVAWGDTKGNSATLYAMATDGGIQAFTVTVPQPQTVQIKSQPQSRTVGELLPVSFSVSASGNPLPTYQWYIGETPIPGATGSTYNIDAAPYADNNAGFKAVVQNIINNITYSVTSSVATLTVIADTNPPVLLRAQSLGLSQVEVDFSERIKPSTATNVASYAIAATNSTVVIVGASQISAGSNVVLAVTGMLEGVEYTLTVKNLEDESAARNVIAPDSRTNFIVNRYAPLAIGNPVIAGDQTPVPGGYDISSGGTDIGGASDQCNYSYQLRSGNFDVAVRLQGLDPSDVFAKAGLMARETLDPGSRFAAALATPAMVGCFFESRSSSGNATSSSGRFAVNYPNNWLRLSRVGNQFSGYASYDGVTWTPLGSANLSMPAQIYLGMTASSHNAGQPTVARFRDLQELANAQAGTTPYPYEPLGPCSRRTPLIISELMYMPAPRSDARNLQYIEIYNSNPWWEDISGYQIAGSVQYTFGTNVIIPGGGFLVIAASPADIQSVYGIQNVLGPFSHNLSGTGTVQLLDEKSSVLLELTYASTLPWPAGAEATGHSIVLARPSYGEWDPRAWALSESVGGSPGTPDAFRPSPIRNVLINEFLAHPATAGSCYIELYNHSTVPVDLSGCVLTDIAGTNRFVVPAGTLAPASGFVVFNQAQLGFELNPSGGLILFEYPDSGRVADAVSYEAQGVNISTGRWPDGATEFYPLAVNTPGNPNGDILIGDIAINEIMYKPISGNKADQYVELYNQGSNSVDIGGWKFTAGIQFTFPSPTVMTPGSYLVVAHDATNLAAHYPNLNAQNLVGDFSGKLPAKGGRLALARPEPAIWEAGPGLTVSNTIYVVKDEVTYQTGGRWGQWAHGGGSSLELIHPGTNHRLAYNWADSDESTKSSWTNLEFTGLLDNGVNYSGSIDLVQLGLLDVGECLVDNVEVRPSSNGANYIANSGFESGFDGWTPQGDHTRSSLETILGGYQSSQCLHLRATDGVWTMFNSVQGTLANTSLQPGSTATLRLKARWLHGSPEILMRLHGNWLELAGAMPLPSNLGTPGAPNSRAVARPSPAIFEVKHSPPLPAANQDAVVTARFHAPASFQPTLRYRIDTGDAVDPSYTEVPMVDDGSSGDAVAGDGVYSATIPGQSSGTVVAFVVAARTTQGDTSVFPAVLQDNSGLPRECVVMFGDTIPSGSFGHYHLWMTQNWIDRWSAHGGLSNEYHDGTFVDGGGRVIYNIQGRFAGSPYHQYLGSPVTTLGGQHWSMPEDDQMLGTTSFNKQHVPGNNTLDDDTLQREQTSYWMARQVGMPWNYRRYYTLFVNGNQHGPLMEDAQVPGGDVINQHWPNDNNGFLYKNNGWFEGATTVDGNGYMNFTMPSWCVLGKFTTTIGGVAGQFKLPRYRWMFWVRQYPDSANNFTNVLALITAANLSNGASFYNSMEALVDTEEWMRMSALEHATGDWDSFFTQNQWNMYNYKPTAGKWTALKWDWNITLGGGTATWGPDAGQLFNVGSNDPIMGKLQNYAPYRRAYLRALNDIANLAMNNTRVNPVLDAKFATFAANGLNVRDPSDPAGLKAWIATMHTSILRTLTNQGIFILTFSIAGPTNFTVGTNSVFMQGTAPIEAKTLTVNGIPVPVTWPNAKAWYMTVPLSGQTNVLRFAGLDSAGRVLSNVGGVIEVVNTNAPANLNPVTINEWMASNQNTLSDPADDKFEDWFELYNPNADFINLSGYFLTDDLATPAKWQIPDGTTIPPTGFRLVWADKGLTNAKDQDLHADFKLNKGGTSIGLFDPSTNLVDAVTFGPQNPDISQGRFPDGGPLVYSMRGPTPRATNQFTNSPPGLAALNDQIDAPGNLLQIAASASDPDAPPQSLRFSLDSGAPSGTAIDPVSGVFTWLPSQAQSSTTNSITVRVTDNGTPALSDAKTFTVVIQAAALGFSGVTLSTGGFPTFNWIALPGRTYRIDFKADLNDAVWQTLTQFQPSGSSGTFTDQTPPSGGDRYYRLVLLP